jgi:hypothetical protein
MRKFLILILLFVSAFVSAQQKTTYYMRYDSTWFKGTINVADIFLRDPDAFKARYSIGSGSGAFDTTSLSNRINSKEPIITEGLSSQYWRGDKVWAAFPPIPAQFNPIAGTNMSITGTYPNMTFNASGGAANLPFIIPSGLVGDSATDNTAAIRAAIDSAESVGGGTVYLPPGDYVCDSLHLPRRVNLIGSGVGVTVLILKANSTAGQFLDLHNTDEATIKDITFDGNKLNQTDTIHGVVIDTDAGTNVPGGGVGNPTNYNYQLLVYRNYFRNFTGNGIVALHPAWVFTVTDNRVRDCDGWGIWNESTDSEFYNNGIASNGMGGIYNRGANTRFIGGKILWNGRDNPDGAGIYIHSASRSQFIGMEVQESYYHGVVLDNTFDCLIQVVSDMNNTKRRPDSLQLGADIDSQDVNAVGYALKMIASKYNSIDIQITSGFEGAKFTQFGKFIDGNSVNNTFIINERKPMLGDSIVFAGKNTWITYQDANKIISADADFTVGEDTSTYIITSTPTVDRVINLPDPSKTLMKKLTFIMRGSTSNTFNWKFSPAVGYVTSTTTYDSIPNNSVVTLERIDNGSGQWRITNIWEPLALAAKQDGILFKDEGTDRGPQGKAKIVNFVGAGVTTSYSNTNDSLTVNIAGGAVDNWGTQVVVTNGTLSGDGTSGTPLGVDTTTDIATKYDNSLKVDKNAAITGATKTKITYDTKGLVTAGADLAEADIPALSISKTTGLQSSLNNMARNVSVNNTQLSHTGNTTETTVFTDTIPGNTLGVNGSFFTTLMLSYTNNANNKIVRVKFNGTQVFSYTGTTAIAARVQHQVSNRNSLTSQVGSSSGMIGFGTAASNGIQTYTFDTSQDIIVTVTIALANAADTMSLESFIITAFP